MDDVIERLVELKKIRDEAQSAIEAILGGAKVEKKQRAPQRCGHCGSEEHSKRTCPQLKDTLPANGL